MKSMMLVFALMLSVVACSKDSSSSAAAKSDPTAKIVKDIDATCSGKSCI